jgi:excisionase family DNA binding protein
MLKPSYEPIILARKPLTGTLSRNLADHGTGALAIDVARFGEDGRWPTNLLTDGAVAAALGDRARYFYCAKPSRAERRAGGHHPTQKPLALMRWLVRLVTPRGGHILDPFAGSGTTGVAALHEGCRFTGIEQDTTHIATARQRMTHHATRPDMLHIWYNSVADSECVAGRTMPANESEYVTVQEAARLLGMGRQALWRKIKELDIPVYRTGRDKRLRLVNPDEVRRAFTPVLATPAAEKKQEQGR